MKSLNKVQIIGNLGQDPEIKTFGNGGKVANFAVATNEDYTDRAGKQVKNTEWHKISVRGKAVDVAEKYLNKGDKVYLEGKLQTRSYDKEGVTHYITELICFSILMLGGQEAKPKAPQSNDMIPPDQPLEQSGGEGDDLPF